MSNLALKVCRQDHGTRVKQILAMIEDTRKKVSSMTRKEIIDHVHMIEFVTFMRHEKDVSEILVAFEEELKQVAERKEANP